MSEAKHTPGPWSAVRSDPAEGADVWWIVAGRDGHNTEHELGSFVGGWPQERREADARLAAAAPDLLGALKVFVERYTEMVNSGDCGFWDSEKDPEVVAARAAIAKATGGAA